MVFSSPLFVFLFLPIVLWVNLLLPKKLSNLFLLLASLAFYAWGERVYIIVMLLSIFINFIFGKLIYNNQKKAKIILTIGVLLNLATLGYFKYANFVISNINLLLSKINFSDSLPLIKNLSLPIGISFFTFQGLSYLVDVYRRETPAQKSIIDLGLYIALFPQLIAGPIVRYHDIALQLKKRIILPDNFLVGFDRFVIGLAKKMILANTFAYIADYIIPLNNDELSTILAWIGILSYSLQIYFDFSGYSDMAIGLGRMMGFNFLENFNYPYISNSIKDFWRRWHISLSSWFRDYLYIPLGGSRGKISTTYINLLIVFFVTGLWHGASWNFVAWGMFHGVFLVSEKLFLEKILAKTPKLITHVYTLLVVITAWVFFRVEDLEIAVKYIHKMYIFAGNTKASQSHLDFILNSENIIISIFGLLFVTPVIRKLSSKVHQSALIFNYMYVTILFALFFIVLFYLGASTYNPFIYYRF